MEEIWKKTYFSDNYEVSNMGRIRSIDRIIYGERPKYGDEISFFRKGNIIAQQLSFNGYPQIRMKINGKRKWILVHKIVAFSFLGEPEKRQIVNHKNGIKTDNRVENLEWCSYSYNNWHAYNVLNKKSYKQRKVICVETGKIFDSCKNASKSVYRRDNAVADAIREGYKCAGFTWRFI